MCVDAVVVWRRSLAAAQLTAMGFAEWQAAVAVQLYGDDLQGASAFLMEDPVAQDQSNLASCLVGRAPAPVDIAAQMVRVDQAIAAGTAATVVYAAVANAGGDVETALRSLSVRGRVGQPPLPPQPPPGAHRRYPHGGQPPLPPGVPPPLPPGAPPAHLAARRGTVARSQPPPPPGPPPPGAERAQEGGGASYWQPPLPPTRPPAGAAADGGYQRPPLPKGPPPSRLGGAAPPLPPGPPPSKARSDGQSAHVTATPPPAVARLWGNTGGGGAPPLPPGPPPAKGFVAQPRQAPLDSVDASAVSAAADMYAAALAQLPAQEDIEASATPVSVLDGSASPESLPASPGDGSPAMYTHHQQDGGDVGTDLKSSAPAFVPGNSRRSTGTSRNLMLGGGIMRSGSGGDTAADAGGLDDSSLQFALPADLLGTVGDADVGSVDDADSNSPLYMEQLSSSMLQTLAI